MGIWHLFQVIRRFKYICIIKILNYEQGTIHHKIHVQTSCSVHETIQDTFVRNE